MPIKVTKTGLGIYKASASYVKGAVEGAKEMGQAGMSKAKLMMKEHKLLNTMVGPEGTFGRENMGKQRDTLKGLMKAGNFKGMRDYMTDQNTRAGIKRIKGKNSAI